MAQQSPIKANHQTGLDRLSKLACSMGNTPRVHFKSILEKLKRLLLTHVPKSIPIAKTHHKTNRVTETKQKPQENKNKSMKEVKRTKALENKKTVGFYLLEGLAMGEEEE